ncbi:hypothetical protein BKA58DRAFT_453902 [Alternaria rosae]|uniref:uncharacterized protein n=1 Tax=Alternaria rosae TaxID=1187941 RepID=UPI001E8CBAA5|nr:uncharacterized protein BKA58DRAFT_453902 [Alternaria rosae]KAH6875077.1 hypothetical protein BKA58DRAFT_453902 [Alternaria rosae]
MPPTCTPQRQSVATRSRMLRLALLLLKICFKLCIALSEVLDGLAEIFCSHYLYTDGVFEGVDLGLLVADIHTLVVVVRLLVSEQTGIFSFEDFRFLSLCLFELRKFQALVGESTFQTRGVLIEPAEVGLVVLLRGFRL